MLAILQILGLAAQLTPSVAAMVSNIISALHSKGATEDEMLAVLKTLELTLQPMQKKE
jgi:hypothetical protein